MADIGFLLIGHGTRNSTGQSQFLAVHEAFRQLVAPNLSIACFLELAEPSIETALGAFAERGISEIITVPMLLFSAGHAQSDIPDAVLAGAKKHAIQVLGQSPELGCSPTLLQLSAQRYRQVVCECSDQCSSGKCENIALGMIGRGSRSESATRKMLEFSALRHQMTPSAFHTTGFVYGQEPDLEQTLDALQDRPEPIIVVQPHLLFEGDLHDRIRARVEARQAADPSRRWLVPSVLGAYPVPSQATGNRPWSCATENATSPQKMLAKALAELALSTVATTSQCGS